MQTTAKGPLYPLPLLGALAAILVSVVGIGYSVHCLSASRGGSDCYEQEVPPGGDHGPNDYTKWNNPCGTGAGVKASFTTRSTAA